MQTVQLKQTIPGIQRLLRNQIKKRTQKMQKCQESKNCNDCKKT